MNYFTSKYIEQLMSLNWFLVLYMSEIELKLLPEQTFTLNRINIR
jgi:hypothetical protein